MLLNRPHLVSLVRVRLFHGAGVLWYIRINPIRNHIEVTYVSNETDF